MVIWGLILFSAISLCWVESVQSESESVESGISNNDERELVDVQTKAELRSILAKVRQKLVPSICTEWHEDDSRAVAVMTMLGHKELWIGTEFSDAEELGIEGLQRMYEIKDLSRGGTRLRGSIHIRLPTHEMEVERACFSKLKNVQVRGSNGDGGGVYEGDLWEMTITEIEFGVLVQPQGVLGERVATGETQVTLTMSEGLVAMALRKSAEHLWALPGSLGLLVVWAVGRIVLRRMQSKWRARSTNDPSV